MAKEVSIDLSDLRLGLLLAHLVHELIDVSTGSMSIGPLLHVQSKVELLLSQHKNFGDLLFLVQLDWIWNLAVHLRFFVQLQNLVEMGV